ncbi:STAS domain-containing protein [Chondromyces apiculatus]|uniref:RsbR, positive regulator of sigma-B n=1 Tax=Chondromyces apiculatus DSM 436 TaxID=1192034 RepID=A0A017STR8_9BACT|nr:STAS domain-containing protein [Chondromyces apiculatus]EYE99989.1 RsbR, positive regulator of sigma-B [Chondromyces apiculatus DSM 436]
MLLAQRLSPLAGLDLAIWVFDIERTAVAWANARAAALWRAPDAATLCTRDFSDMSEATRTRLASYLDTFRQGGTIEETWTFYPHGLPVTARCLCSGVPLDDGRTAMLVHGLPSEARPEPDTLRGVEALRHTTVMVSLLDPDGSILMHNPAAARAFADAPLDTWFDPATARTLLDRTLTTSAWEAELLAHTANGDRWHALESRTTNDPVTGARVLLVHQTDITRRVEDASTISQQRARILALSAPLLDVAPHVLAIPLIGSLSDTLTDDLTARLLQHLTRARIHTAILDLTGTTEADDPSTARLLQLAAAIRLLGARPLITGVSPTLARTLVTRGAPLTDILVLRSLHEAIATTR